MASFGPRRLAFAAGALAVGAATLVVPGGAHAAPPTPTLRLFTGIRHLEIDRFGTDPHLFISDAAYVGSVNGAFEIDAVRHHKHIVLRQVIRNGNHTSFVRTIKPTTPVRMQVGLPDFFTLRLRNASGALVASSKVPFCPAGGYDSQRIDPSNSPSNPTYPQQCGSKLTRATLWGIDAGWADGIFAETKATPDVAPDGNYTLTISITRTYARQLRVPTAEGAATVGVTLKTESDGCIDVCAKAGRTARLRAAALRRRGAVAYPRPVLGGASGVGSPGLPDLVALPAHDLAIRHAVRSNQDWLGFGATIWNAGPGTFDIEGFRHSGRRTMQARQYIGRPNGSSTEARIGTFEFDNRPGHHHWHLEDVARYTLLDAAGDRVVRSHKQSFCLAPTDPVNLLRRGAQWNPNSIGLYSACPSDQSLWLRETLPVGWGDTYVQEAGGQAFNITSVPNGTYLVRITTNPRGRIHEVTRSNNSSYLKITLGGVPGARTLTTVGPVPAP
jgi:hypothetical protein